MKWVKKGLIYNVNKKYFWNQSHAQVPTVDIINNNIWRIYYASRDKDNRSYTSYIDVEAGKPENILYEHDKPILSIGKLGSFDDCGIMPSCIINNYKKKYFYYFGWNVRNTIPYHNSIGLALSEDNGNSFYKYSAGPLFERNYKEPYFSATPWIIKEENILRMWYLSGTGWEIINGKPEAFYNIKYAESKDGINWERSGKVMIDFKNKKEGAISRPCMIKENDLYKMWYSYRSVIDYRTNKENSYRIGYAESEDGINWERMDNKTGIDISEDGWDSTMIEYTNIVSFNNSKYLFYNGNEFGETGFGYAVLENN